MKQTWHLNIKIANEGNSTEHWTKKAKRHKKQKFQIKKAFLIERPQITIPHTIVLTRIAPRELDCHDNLPMSMKWIVDAIADWFFPGQQEGRADDTKEIRWTYRQAKGKVREYRLIIEMNDE